MTDICCLQVDQADSLTMALAGLQDHMEFL